MRVFSFTCFMLRKLICILRGYLASTCHLCGNVATIIFNLFFALDVNC